MATPLSTADLSVSIVHDQKITADATAEEVAAYEEATGSVNAHIWCREKKNYVPLYALARHRRKPRAIKTYDFSKCKTDAEKKEMREAKMKDKTYFELTHGQLAEIRKAQTFLKEGVIDSKFETSSPHQTTLSCRLATPITTAIRTAIRLS